VAGRLFVVVDRRELWLCFSLHALHICFSVLFVCSDLMELVVMDRYYVCLGGVGALGILVVLVEIAEERYLRVHYHTFMLIITYYFDWLNTGYIGSA